MSIGYLGEIRLVGFNFAPPGWLSCDGSLLPISVYDTLFQLIGTTYGGDGSSTFALPDLRGRASVGVAHLAGANPAYALGETGGQETVTLTSNTMPTHTHQASGSSVGDTSTPGATTVWGLSSTPIYGTTIPNEPYTGATPGTMAPDALQAAGSGLPHENQPPYLAVHHIICVDGIFPSTN